MKSLDDLRALASQGITLKDLAKLEGLEWVQSTGRRQGYFRRISKNRLQPSYIQACHRLIFSELSCSGFGQKGVEETNEGKIVSKHAMEIGRSLKGTGRPRPKETTEQKLIRLILEIKHGRKRATPG